MIIAIFIYPGGMNYLEEYYDDSHDYNTASRVTVSAGQTTSNIDMALDYGFDHDASVMNIHLPDGSCPDVLFVLPGWFCRRIPPLGISFRDRFDSGQPHDYSPGLGFGLERVRAVYIDGSPEPGVHVFTATMTDGHVVVSTDYQYVIQTIPNPDTASTFSPAEGIRGGVQNAHLFSAGTPLTCPACPSITASRWSDNVTDERVRSQ